MLNGGFFRRLGACFIDFILLLIILLFVFLLENLLWLDRTYSFLIQLIVGVWFNVYLVKKYEGTPGKLLLKIKIIKMGGGKISYQDAFMRYSVIFILNIVLTIAIYQGSQNINFVEYAKLDYMKRLVVVGQTVPDLYNTISNIITLWCFIGFVVLLANYEQRAAHDFIGGTIVVREMTIKDAFKYLILAVSEPETTEEQILKSLEYDGVPLDLGYKMFNFTKIAWGREYLRDKRYLLSEKYYCFNDNGSLLHDCLLDNDPNYVYARDVYNDYKDTTAFEKIALESEEVSFFKENMNELKIYPPSMYLNSFSNVSVDFVNKHIEPYNLEKLVVMGAYFNEELRFYNELLKENGIKAHFEENKNYSSNSLREINLLVNEKDQEKASVLIDNNQIIDEFIQV